MGPERTRRWAGLFDPSRYLPGVTCPILFVNGTNDFAYPMGSYQRVLSTGDESARRPLHHGKDAPRARGGWEPKEIGLFVDSVLKGDPPLPRLAVPVLSDRTISSVATARGPLHGARLHYTADRGPWQKRNWTTADARLDGKRLAAELPEAAADRGILHGRGRTRGRR